MQISKYLAILFIFYSFLHANKLDEIIKEDKLPNEKKIFQKEIIEPKKVKDSPNSSFLVEKLNHPLSPILLAMKKEEWEKAKKLLENFSSEEQFKMDILFLQGTVHEKLALYHKSSNFYRKMLEINSDLARVRFELAKVLYLSNELAASEYQFRLLLSLGLPKEVEYISYKYLESINKQKFSWQFSFALKPTNNVNQGTKNKTIMIDGREYVLSDDTQAKKGIGLESNLFSEYKFSKDLKWFANAYVSHTDFSNYKNDNTYAQVNIGRMWLHDKSKIRLNFGLNYMHHLHKKLYHGYQTGISSQYQVNSNISLNNRYNLQKYMYRNNYSHLEALQNKLSSSISYIHNSKTLYDLTLRSVLHNAKDDSNSYLLLGAKLNIINNIDWQNLTIGSSFSFENKKYKKDAVFFRKRKKNKEYDFELSFLKRNWYIYTFAPKLKINYNILSSNIDLYDAKTKSVNLIFTKTF